MAKKTVIKPPSATDIAQLLDHSEATGDRLAALWSLAAYSGCREGELLALRWSDVDLDKGRIAIERTLLGIKNHAPDTGPPKSDKSIRNLAIPAAAVESLQRHAEQQKLERDRSPYYAMYGRAEHGEELQSGIEGRRAADGDKVS